MKMTDAELRIWLRNPQWRAQLHHLIAEEPSGAGEVAAEVSVVAAVSPTVSVPVGLVPSGERLPEPPQVEKSGAVREEDLADYEEGGVP